MAILYHIEVGISNERSINNLLRKEGKTIKQKYNYTKGLELHLEIAIIKL